MTDKKLSREAYDRLYAQFNMLSKPFGYSPDYLFWRDSKIKGEICHFIKKDGIILDVGGGFGILVKFLPDFVDVNVNYINSDISVVMLKYSPYQNVCAAGEFLPFRENSFDYVICSEVLEHVSDKLMVLRECYRILKPKGLLLLTTPRTGWKEDFKKSPFVIFLYLDSIFNKFVNSLKRASPVFIPEGVRDEPSDERWLKAMLEKTGFMLSLTC